MSKESWTITEVLDFFEVEENFLSELEKEEIVCPTCCEGPPFKLFPLEEIEKLRLAKILVEDMGVNLPGVEVVLRMRRNIVEMRRQFDAILEDVAKSLQESMGEDSPFRV
jgi:MerR family transcriptional regulator/heat shock protein HspR